MFSLKFAGQSSSPTAEVAGLAVEMFAQQGLEIIAKAKGSSIDSRDKSVG